MGRFPSVCKLIDERRPVAVNDASPWPTTLFVQTETRLSNLDRGSLVSDLPHVGF